MTNEELEEQLRQSYAVINDMKNKLQEEREHAYAKQHQAQQKVASAYGSKAGSAGLNSYNKGVLSRYAKKTVNPNYYEKVIIEDDRFFLCIGNGPRASEWERDELREEVVAAKAKLDAYTLERRMLKAELKEDVEYRKNQARRLLLKVKP